MVYNSFLYNQNMNKVWAFIPVAFAIFALMISPGISAYAAEPSSCNNEKAKHVGNKHCGDTTSSTQFTICDMNKDGSIVAQELVDYANSLTVLLSLGDATNLINNNDFNSSSSIDTKRELSSLNDEPDLVFTCS